MTPGDPEQQPTQLPNRHITAEQAKGKIKRESSWKPRGQDVEFHQSWSRRHFMELLTQTQPDESSSPISLEFPHLSIRQRVGFPSPTQLEPPEGDS